MSIEFVCPSCQKTHRAPPELAGRQARCTCGAVLVVPSLAEQVARAGQQGFAQAPSVVPHSSPTPSAAPPNDFDPSAWADEAAAHSKPAAMPSHLAKLLAKQRMLVIGIGAGLGAILLLALITWMFFGREGVSDAMRYLPDDCMVVGTSNNDELMSSSFYQQMKKDLPEFESSERSMEQELGVAPSNIRRTTFAFGGKMTSPDDAEMVVVLRLKKAVSATDIKSNLKVTSGKKDVKYEEVKIGSVTAYEETYRFSFDNDNADRRHGGAFCLPESTLIVTCPKLEALKKILERGKTPEFSEGMQNAMNAADFSRTFAVAVNVKGLMANEAFSQGLQQNVHSTQGLQGLDEQFLQNVLGLAVDANLDSSKATVNVTLLCKETKVAEDSKKILEGTQVVLRNYLKSQRGMPSEVPDMVDSIKFSVSGATVKGNLQTSLEPLSKWIKEQAGKR